MTDDIRVFEFTALSIDQEHWTMAVVRCDCGAGWVTGTQSLTSGPTGPVDEWEVHCDGCGARARFRFNISAFFGYQDGVERWVQKRLPEAEAGVRGRIARKIGPPFGTRFLSVVKGLATDGDVPTLLYLRAQIDRAIAGTQAGGPGAGSGPDEPVH